MNHRNTIYTAATYCKVRTAYTTQPLFFFFWRENLEKCFFHANGRNGIINDPSIGCLLSKTNNNVCLLDVPIVREKKYSSKNERFEWKIKMFKFDVGMMVFEDSQLI
jgi:hypothetical protein